MLQWKNRLTYFLYCQFYNWKSFLVYRLQAAVWAVFEFLLTIMNFATITVIYKVSSGIAGWSYFQLLLLSAVTSLLMTILWFLINPDGLVRNMRRGKLDMYLTKPYGVFTIVVSNFGSTSSLFGFFSSALLMLYAMSNLALSQLQILLYMVLFTAGAISFMMFIMVVSMLSYLLFKSGSFIGRFVDMVESMSRYPLSIYGFSVQFVLSLLIPIGIASYYPTQTIFGRIDLGVYATFLVAALLIAVVSYKLFYRIMREYTSGGG